MAKMKGGVRMAKTYFYWESIGEVVSQVYEIKADNWEDAKRKAFDDMAEGDVLAECPASAVVNNSQFTDYNSIDENQCINFARLGKGIWAASEPSGSEYWEDRVWFFSDDDETYLNGSYKEFTDWKQDDED